MKIYLFVLVAFLSCSANYAQSDFQKDIKKLLEISGSAKLGIQVMNQMIPYFQSQYPSVPEKFWSDFAKEIDEGALIEQIVPIYEKYYTHEEIKGLIKFYETPLGKKTVSVLPKLTQESMLAGQKWGMDVGEKIVKKLQQEGYIE